MKRGLVAAFAAACLLTGSCATDGTAGAAVGVYDGFYYDDPWWYYGSGGGWWLVDGPEVGPPRPEHPIANPPGGPRPEHPIARPDPPKATPTPSARPSTSRSRPMPSARPALRGGGGRR